MRVKKAKEIERVRLMNKQGERGSVSRAKNDVFYYNIPDVTNIEELEQFSKKMKKSHDSPRLKKQSTTDDISIVRQTSSKFLDITPINHERDLVPPASSTTTLAYKLEELTDPLPLHTMKAASTTRLLIPIQNKKTADDVSTTSFGITNDAGTADGAVYSPAGF